MVLDIRRTQQQVVVPPTPETIAAKPMGQAIGVSGVVHTDIEALLETMVEESAGVLAQAKAALHLRELVLGVGSLDTLWGIVETGEDRRRLAAALVLGFHRGWLSTTSGPARLLQRLRSETDPEVARVLVWCLRQRDEVAEFLAHDIPNLAREAALGLPLNSQTLEPLVGALAGGIPGDVDRILLDKLQVLHPSLVSQLVASFRQHVPHISDDRISRIFSRLSQVPLFDLFMEKRYSPEGMSDVDLPGSSITQTSQRLARHAERIMREQPSVELLRSLFNRCVEDDTFVRRHANFLRATLQGADVDSGPELLRHLEQLLAAACDAKVERLAQLLVDLSKRLDGQGEHKAAALLENLKRRSPDLKLKIYHMQQGLT